MREPPVGPRRRAAEARDLDSFGLREGARAAIELDMERKKVFEKLVAHHKRVDRLGAAAGILFWDEQVNLPPDSAAFRAEQNGYLSELLHREATPPEVGEWLATLESGWDDLSTDERVVVKNARREYDRETKLPGEFVARRSKARSESFHAWVEARKNNDFNSFAPHLRKALDFALEEAGYQGAENAYDYFIDRYDPGMSTAVIDPLFKDLREGIKPVLETILAAGDTTPPDLFRGFPVDGQEAFLREVVAAFGFDFGRGRIDRAVHPFCGGHPLDTRMTTRYDPDNPLDSLSSAMHETGHALYEQGLPADYPGTALSEAAGMAAHESQSRIWENQVGRGRAFWRHWEPRYRECFGAQLAAVDSEQLYKAINRVAITPIRVDADEVTYNLHILLRYGLERDLFAGRVAIGDLPDAWNERSRDLLGFTPESNTEGCLQDVHWCEGMFGYFPSYTLGNLLAAQFWYAALDALPGLEEDFARGEYGRLLTWLRENVHRVGRRLDANGLARKVTGSPLGAESLLRYLRERYLPLYRT